MVYLGLNGPHGCVLGFLLRDAESLVPLAEAAIMVEGSPLGPTAIPARLCFRRPRWRIWPHTKNQRFEGD